MPRLPLALLGLLLAALALLALPIQRAARTAGATLGLPDPALDARPANLFAANVALERASPLETERALDTLADAGFGWVRQNFRWADIEPVQGRYDWATADRIVDLAHARGLGVIAVLLTTPEWARSDHAIETAPPVDEAHFADFARAFALRYGDRVDVYQIWDEPNLAAAWGRPDSAPDYLRVLRPAYLALHAADPGATVLLAALAPTLETGPNNLSDLLYLRALYLAGAAPYFDAAAGKPYGFDHGPLERGADPNVLNFSRFTLLREEMARHGDAHKLLWAGHFGWNALPAGWSGEPSLWGAVDEQRQAEYTAQAYARALAEWPWAGPLALENFQPDPDPPGLNPFGADPARDARWGFALVDAGGRPRPALDAVRALARETRALPPGNHPADAPLARYEGAWEFSDLGADIPQFGPARVTIDFVGTDLAVRARRADYRAYLYVTVDGQPAPGLPRDARGAYRVLTSPDLMPRIETLTLARGLPYGRHTAVIEAERGWDQWAIIGYSVGYAPDDRGYLLGLAAAGAVALVCALVLWREVRRDRALLARAWAWMAGSARGLLRPAPALVTTLTAGLLWLSAALTWGGDLPQLARRLGETTPLAASLLAAGAFYLSPWLVLTVLSLLALFVLFYLRLDIGLALVALFMPFYLQPRPLFDRAFSMVEITTVLAVAALVALKVGEQFATKAQHLRPRLRCAQARVRHEEETKKNPFAPLCLSGRVSSLDLAVLAFVVVSVLSALAADVRGVALRELRVVLLEPALFYLLLRAAPLDRRGLWRVVDFWMIGAVVVAAIGLYQYLTGTNLIAAEAGVLRLRSVYGSPNNVGLYLGRALPVLAAVALLGGEGPRRVLYALGALAVLPALVLSFSKGALLLGLPASLAVVALFWGGARFGWGRAAAAVAALGAAAAALALGPLSRVPRFANLLDLSGGTAFFRVRLWGSAAAMIRDHPWLGVGPDNFLYAYRGGYINPEAWQEPNLSHAHNFALDFAARLGLPGLGALAWMLLAFLRDALAVLRSPSNLAPAAPPQPNDPSPLPPRPPAPRTAGFPLASPRAALAIGLVASMVNFLAHGLVDASFFFVDLAFVFFLTLGLMARLKADYGMTADRGE